MSFNIRNVPALAAALRDLARDHVPVRGPEIDGMATHWIPCDCCDAVVAAPLRVVSIICGDCAAPCPHADCGLAIYEHGEYGCEAGGPL